MKTRNLSALDIVKAVLFTLLFVNLISLFVSTTDFLVYSRSYIVDEYSDPWRQVFLDYRKLAGNLSYVLVASGFLTCVCYVLDLIFNKKIPKGLVILGTLIMVAMAVSMLITTYNNPEIFKRYDEIYAGGFYSTILTFSSLVFAVFVNGSWGFLIFGIFLLLLSFYDIFKDSFKKKEVKD